MRVRLKTTPKGKTGWFVERVCALNPVEHVVLTRMVDRYRQVAWLKPPQPWILLVFKYTSIKKYPHSSKNGKK